MTTPSRRAFLATSLFTTACTKKLAKRFNGYAFIANPGSRSVQIVNLSRFQVEKTIPFEADPSQILAPPASPRTLILTPANGTVTEISAETQQITRRARIAKTALAMQQNTGTLWVLTPQALIPLSLRTFQPGHAIHLPNTPTSFDLAPNGTHAAIATRQFTLFQNLATPGPAPRLESPFEPALLRFRPDGKQLLIGHAAAHALSIVDAASAKLLVTLPLPVTPSDFCFSTDNGGQLFVSGPGMDAVCVVAPYQTVLSETILAGRQPGALAVNETQLFVANTGSGDLTVINIDDRQVLSRIQTGTYPTAIALTPDREYALVLNRDSADLAVIRLSKLVDLRYKRAPLFTLIPIGGRPTAMAVCRL